MFLTGTQVLAPSVLRRCRRQQCMQAAMRKVSFMFGLPFSKLMAMSP